MRKNLYIKTYGCQMNIYDSQRMTDVLAPLGFDIMDSPEAADLVIFNTCHIREKAAEKLYSDLGRIKPVKQHRLDQGQDMMIAVAGCTAQAEGAEVMRRAPYVDMVFGPQAYHQLPEMLARAIRAKEARQNQTLRGAGILNVDFSEDEKFDALPEAQTIEGASAFVSIQEGCDKFCHFCVVPYTRGAEYSRPVKAVLQEIRHLATLGIKEITLLGQNVNAYHGESPQDATKEWGLGRLIREVADIAGIEIIRYTTSHPRDVDDDLIQAHRDVRKLAPYLHLPVQSGSDRILKAMNRKHTRETYYKLIDQFRAARPNIAFSSDFIVGYPGEDERDHQETLALIETVKFAQAYSFKYSKRPGTPAWALTDQIDEAVKDRRLQEVQALLNHQQKSFNEGCLGQEMALLFERKGRHEGQLIGRSPFMQSVHVLAPERLLGQCVRVKIIGSGNNSLTGEVITGDY
jgi:tRNA-2-methylthio-N6-dimethylallyladenosine synthase